MIFKSKSNFFNRCFRKYNTGAIVTLGFLIPVIFMGAFIKLIERAYVVACVIAAIGLIYLIISYLAFNRGYSAMNNMICEIDIGPESVISHTFPVVLFWGFYKKMGKTLTDKPDQFVLLERSTLMAFKKTDIGRLYSLFHGEDEFLICEGFFDDISKLRDQLKQCGAKVMEY